MDHDATPPAAPDPLAGSRTPGNRGQRVVGWIALGALLLYVAAGACALVLMLDPALRQVPPEDSAAFIWFPPILVLAILLLLLGALFEAVDALIAFFVSMSLMQRSWSIAFFALLIPFALLLAVIGIHRDVLAIDILALASVVVLLPTLLAYGWGGRRGRGSPVGGVA